MHHVRLFVEGVAAFAVGVVVHRVFFPAVDKGKRAVVEGFAQNRHVVGVHNAMQKAVGNPARYGMGAGLADGLEHGQIRFFCVAALWVPALQTVVGQHFQIVVLAAVVQVFEVAKAYVAAANTDNGRAGLQSFPHHLLAVHAQGQCPC